MKELSVIQKTEDAILWFVPFLERLSKTHKYTLGERMINRLYNLLEGLIEAKYSREKLSLLKKLNLHLDILNHQMRLLQRLNLISVEKYEYASKLLNGIGVELGLWIRKQQDREKSP